MIPRSSTPRRKKYLAKSSHPIRKVNPKRHAKNWLRSYGSVERVEWVKSLPCLVNAVCRGRVENVHIESGGKSRKADADKVVPLCERHHHVLHNSGRFTFEDFYRIDLDKAAAETQQKWLEFSGESA